ncbi:DUF3037 domain-containing protein [Candidatus Symbiopectobacterium sp. NZEC127]|uniref:DUF3037 domain-containing protein n=1 Tax=Candidatus Symbiopectobacterium sp. NZEC127 TaxID=2820472 RepID=UPI0022266D06|nr:DUF3037 domain-containing protein [Candidatus Symbiopectobacterium sp. NZEC127]MCW2485750.1 DUF3037 domain-containing protein [Candidatus Symbiopectobacterium sp. NZEC127]
MTMYKYSIIRITPSPVRAESINVGFVITSPGGVADVRILDSSSKIKAVTNDYSMENLESLKMQLEKMLSDCLTIEQAMSFFQGSVTLSPIGTFSAESAFDYDENINNINKLYISPIKAIKRSSVTQKRIITELKGEFERFGIMGKNVNEIHDHKVVQGYPLSEEEGLYAELLLKNGVYHLTETLDFRSSNLKQKLGDSAVKAITMNTAKAVWRDEVNTFLVYAADASQERTYSQQINLVNSYADKMFNLLSASDMSAYFEHMVEAAGRNMPTH